MDNERCVQKKNLHAMSEDELRSYADSLEDRLEKAYQLNLKEYDARDLERQVAELKQTIDTMTTEHCDYVRGAMRYVQENESRIDLYASEINRSHAQIRSLKRKLKATASSATSNRNAAKKRSFPCVATVETHLL